MDSMDDCNICLELYDENIRPRSLPCGHSYCVDCIGKLIKRNLLECPTCKKSHRASSPLDFPINFGMEAVISNLRYVRKQKATKKSERVTFTKQPGNASDKLMSIFKEQKESLREQIRHSKHLQRQLEAYESFLSGREAHHLKLRASNDEVVQLITAECQKVVALKQEGLEHATEAQDMLDNFQTYTATRDIATAIDEIQKSSDTIQNWRASCEGQVPNDDTAKYSNKILRDIQDVIKSIKGHDDATLVHETETGNWYNPFATISLTELQKKSKATKNALEKGHIYAIQNREGRFRAAKVTARDGRTFLHHLEDKRPPQHVQTIVYSQLNSIISRDAVEVFLDLSWGGSYKGRIHILLSPDTPLARHFKILCTGEAGPTYAGTTLLEVGNKGNTDREWIKGGDYSTSQHTGLTAPLINHRPKIYKRRNTSGAVKVVFYVNAGYKITEFKITTGRGNRFNCWPIVGLVQQGLDLLKEAAKQVDICSVVIEDSGVILPL